ncbi:hypothetical protein BGP78_10340 [Pseudoalteromonas sp. MSK9-3]|uniref:hypothetical protein n=1 Tax=Pseudoalteromonas sp. MSK9-3 TaxID=1897633 RepID=UPI000E6C3698|nr:hypothetical protein [Pseudoalteromonas sp. MSK9-3]RJE76801.1 hypothetical protein BGP78_10340 [Pseudoalteromonas sp. MSK9-3]
MKSIYYFDCDKQSPQAILMGMKLAARKSRKNQSEVIVFVPQLEQVNGGIFDNYIEQSKCTPIK